MNEGNKNEMNKLKIHLEKSALSPNLPVSDALDEINVTLKELVAKEVPEPPELPKYPTEMTMHIPGVAQLVGPKGEKGDSGTNGTNGQNGKDGKDGKPGRDSEPIDISSIVSSASALTEERLKPFIPTIEDIENDLPKLGEKIRDSLELLQGDERLDISAIKGLKENIDTLTNLANRPQYSMASIAGRDIFKDIDISDQLDGLTKTFNISAIWTVISIDLSSFPYGSLRKNIDYTWTPTSITFTDQIDAATQLSAGQSCVLTVVNS